MTKNLTHEIRTETHGVCSDLISRQAAIDSIKREREHVSDRFGWYGGMSDCIDLIESLPSADAVEVVRCKDCKHRHDICSMRYIEIIGEDERIHDYSTDNGYCSWGERREDGEDE